jgi:ribosomal protein L37AE/L43A
MNSCPCCSEPLLRHIRHSHIYWFCPRCRQEMPALDLINAKFHQKLPRMAFPRNLSSEQIFAPVK